MKSASHHLLPFSLAAALALALPLHAGAQAPMPRSYVASPDVYKVLAQNDQVQVIDVRWQAGQKDVMHSHPASGVYYLTDCRLRLHWPDGTSRDVAPKAGMAIAQAPIPAHVLENIGSAECRLVMFEPTK